MSNPKRACPSDFVEVFLRTGWENVKDHYGVQSQTIGRWLEEAGKERLTALRAAVVASSQGDVRARKNRARAYIRGQRPPRSEPPSRIVRAAAHFLRHTFRATKIAPGRFDEWWVGTRSMTGLEMLQYALATGFNEDDAEKYLVGAE